MRARRGNRLGPAHSEAREILLALTRKMLKAMGIEDEKIDQIIEEHAESVDALKAQRDELKEAAGKADGYKKELDALKEAAGKADGYKKELDALKTKVEGEKAAAEKRGLYRQLLESAGVDPKRIDTVLKVSDLEGVTVKDGAIEDADKLTEGIKADWADFIATTTVKGADVAHAPKGEGGKDINEMSTAEYMKYKAEQRG